MNAVTKIEDKPASQDPMLAVIERVMTNPDMPIDRIGALLDVRERQMNKEAEQAFNVAFAAAMAEMPDVPRNGNNKHLGRKYSTVDDLIRTARPVLSRHGLSLNWQTGEDGDRIRITASVRHSMGHKIETTKSGARDNGKQMNALQGAGSTETYLKRYTGFAILGLSSGDETEDDGVGAGASTITEAQFHEIRDLIEKAGVEESVVLSAAKASSLEFIKAADFAPVCNRLRKTIEKKAAGQ